MMKQTLLTAALLTSASAFAPPATHRAGFSTLRAEAEEGAVDAKDYDGEPAAPSFEERDIFISKVFYDGEEKRTEGDEYIEISNKGEEACSIAGYRINAGDKGQDFTFPEGTTLEASQTFRVYTNRDTAESDGEFSFESKSAIWNNEGDIAYLYGPSGSLMDEFGYGNKAVDEPDAAVPEAVPAGGGGAAAAVTTMEYLYGNGEKSPAVPFLPYPQNLKGYVGDDIAFDPLRISDYFPMDYLREAELKHSRIAMLAITGWITVDAGIIVHPYGAGLTSATAHDFMVEKGVMGNALVFIGLFEIVSYLGVAEMLQGSGRDPGDFNFGTWYFTGKTEKEIKLLRYQELKNGRLAMLAFGGVVTQSILFDATFPYIGGTFLE